MQCAFIRRMAQFANHRNFDFFDEAHVDDGRLIRDYGWALDGERLFQEVNLQKGKRFSILVVFNYTGVIHSCIKVGTFSLNDCAAVFTAAAVRAPPGTIFVGDNATQYHDPRIAGLLRNAGHILIHQPAYSPRFQPAEHWFSCLRHEMQLHNDEYLALGEQWRPGPLALYIFSDEPRANATLCGDDSPLWS